MSSVDTCTGFWETCTCIECCYAADLYAELDYLESFEPENTDEIERIKEELDTLGYSY